MQIGLRQVSAETVEWFEAACKGGELTRAALARAPCERGSWRGPSGRPCLASARRMLPLLAEASGVHLPDAPPPSRFFPSLLAVSAGRANGCVFPSGGARHCPDVT